MKWPNADEFDAMSDTDKQRVRDAATEEANQAAIDAGMNPPYGRR